LKINDLRTESRDGKVGVQYADSHYCDYKKPTVSVLFAVVHFPFLKSPEPIQEQGHIFNHQNNLRFQKPLPLYSIRDQTEIIENKFKSLQLSSL